MVGAQRKCVVQVERPVSARYGPSGAGGGAHGQRCARRPSRRPGVWAQCLFERPPILPWWRRSLRVFARHQQNILCGTAFHPHDQIGCAASESSSPSRIGGSTPTSTLTGSARDGSARIGPPPESGRITTGGSRHPDRDHRGPAAAQHHTVGDLEHPGDGEGHASVQSHDGEAGTGRQCVIYGGRR